MNKEMLDILNELTKKPTTELALSYMETVTDNIEKDKEISRLNNIINKAIEYIENSNYDIIGRVCSFTKLLKILKGENNE